MLTASALFHPYDDKAAFLTDFIGERCNEALMRQESIRAPYGFGKIIVGAYVLPRVKQAGWWITTGTGRGIIAVGLYQPWRE